ncbi:MAG: enoyl-CoA hydratase/isomerase family protein [Saprospiraceae bacterium]|nr:enoyl-CoA hydratase/isomerase family protein [Saprospiraceae bacterium]
MPYQTILVENQAGVVLVTLNRPQALNAINGLMMEELLRLFRQDLPGQTDIKGVILTGAGDRAFVAGADISEFLGFNQENIETFIRRGHQTFNAIEDFDRPVIAAINGYALGGGCELAMACHFRIATRNSRFGQPEVNLGIIPGYGGTQRLVQLIGKSRGLDLLMTGDMIDAETAEQWGLVNYLVEVGDEIIKAREMIEKIADKAPLAISKIISTVNAFYNKNKNGFELEIAGFAALTDTNDFKEGSKAFLEKRKAIFKENKFQGSVTPWINFSNALPLCYFSRFGIETCH